MSADDMCAPCVQAPKGRDPLQELTEKTAASEAELREIKYARMYCDKGVPRYTLLRQSWYVNRKRRSFEEDDVMTCMCDEDQGCGPGCMNREMMYECLADECKVPGCQNQRFRRRQYAKLEVFPTPGKGYGLRCATDLEEGEFVVEYMGEILDAGEFKRRTEQYDNEGDQHWYFMQIDADNTVDASRMSNLARFMNHCCEPNCMTQKWAVDGEIAVGFFTTQFVPAGTELTFDYNFERYSDKTIECKCGAPSCTGFIGGDASAKQLELASESDEEMDGDDDDASPTKKAKKVVQRDLLGRAITKKKEEKAWAPGMSEGWSSDDEDMSDGEPEDDDDGATRAKKRKATASGSRKRQKKSGPLGTTSKTAARQRWKEQHPDHTPFELEMYEMCDSAGGVSKASVSKLCVLLTQKRLGGDKDACSKLLTALAKTRHESARQHFILKVDGLQVINATIKKFVLVDSGVDEAFAQTVMDVLNSMSLIINSNVAAFRTNCTIGTTLGDLAKAADEKGLRELSRSCGKYGAEINEKVQKFDAIHSITIARSASKSVAERPVDKSALGTVFVGNLPPRWSKREVRDWLASPDVQMNSGEILAVELLGRYKEGQQGMVECTSGLVATTLVDNVKRLAQNQRQNRQTVYEARKMNMSEQEKQAKAVQEAAQAAALAAPRWSNSYGISPRDSTGGGSMLSPTGSVGSVGSASGWGGSGSMISPTLNGSISGGAGSSLTSPVPTPSTSPKEKPKEKVVEDGYTVFRRELSAVISKQLSKYFRDKMIASKDDFKYLCRKITHTIMEKEMKANASNLKVDEGTKRKVAKYLKDFFKKLPSKVYVKPEGKK